MEQKRLPKSTYLDTQKYVRDHVDLIDLFAEFGAKIERNGGKYTLVQCLIHNSEDCGTGRISTEKGYQVFRCYSTTCKVHGKTLDVIATYQELSNLKGENFTYLDAMLDLYCNRLGQAMPNFEEVSEEEAAINAAELEKKKNLDLLFKHTVVIAEKLLADPVLGVEGRKYLEQRKISPSFQKAYHIGFIPSGYNISNDLEQRGFSREFMTEVGYLSKKTGNDTLFNRIVIPMWNEQYDVLNPEFSFRHAEIENLYTRTVVIKNDRDKLYKHRYINQQLPFFNIKSCFGKQSIILVEGIVDCLSVQDAILKMKAFDTSAEKFSNVGSAENIGVVATYGTNGLTTEKMKKYLGSFKTIYLAADNDPNNAGQTANLKRANILKQLFPKTNIKLVTWKEKDANDMLVSGAPATDFWDCLNKAISPEEFALKNVCRHLTQKSGITEMFALINELKPILSAIDCSDTLKVATFAKFVEKQTHIPYDAIVLSMLTAHVSTNEALAILSEMSRNEKNES